ncbi:hypothetical protein GOP47_0010509 [Adiantum capillus-veneris]|uniref:Uncharacterized protein n=1 Tax=Adiantum capillus-veneris TaxID=13818 RepID=A0A9D4UV15_ADICA|nr:hypothetical protein GOP47_0010509 [Adiantum capillus-veneris]
MDAISCGQHALSYNGSKEHHYNALDLIHGDEDLTFFVQQGMEKVIFGSIILHHGLLALGNDASHNAGDNACAALEIAEDHTDDNSQQMLLRLLDHLCIEYKSQIPDFSKSGETTQLECLPLFLQITVCYPTSEITLARVTLYWRDYQQRWLQECRDECEVMSEAA